MDRAEFEKGLSDLGLTDEQKAFVLGYTKEQADTISEIGAMLQKACNLGASQAAEMDRFWAEFGLLDEKITVNDAIAFFKAKDEQIKTLEIEKEGMRHCHNCGHWTCNEDKPPVKGVYEFFCWSEIMENKPCHNYSEWKTIQQ